MGVRRFAVSIGVGSPFNAPNVVEAGRSARKGEAAGASLALTLEGSVGQLLGGEDHNKCMANSKKGESSHVFDAG